MYKLKRKEKEIIDYSNNKFTNWEKEVELILKKYPQLNQQQFHLVNISNYSLILWKRGTPPYADGDVAMESLFYDLNLPSICKETPRPIVVDVGGLYGDFGIAVGMMGCEVYIYEPQHIFVDTIKASIRINNLQSHVFVRHRAVTTQKQISIVREGGLTHTIKKEENEKKEDNLESVLGESLDSFFKNKQIFLLKVDVEGWEEDVIFNSAKDLLSNNGIKHIIAEYTPFWEDRGTNYEEFLPRLYSFGAKDCFSLHRRKKTKFYIPQNRISEFFKSHKSSHLQTDIYCDFTGETKTHHPIWTPHCELR